MAQGFKGLTLLAGTGSPVSRERESNREIPEVFAYVNNNLHKSSLAAGKSYYETYNIRKFGYWLGADKKKAHQELEELAFAGAAKGILKAMNRVEIPTQLFLVFTPGGVDFVGGYTFYNLLKSGFEGAEPKAGASLGKLELSEKTGEEIHQKLFESGSVKTPGHWKKIVSYY